MQIKSSAPGSLMLLGEYAVLYGKPALVCAIDKRIHVTLTPREDNRVVIQSALRGEYVVELDSQVAVRPEEARTVRPEEARTVRPEEAHGAVSKGVSKGVSQGVSKGSGQSVENKYPFVLAAVKHMQAKMRHGCTLEITSEFSDKVGFGSSAAVTVAVLAALVTWLDIKMTPLDLMRHGRNVVRAVQGTASGADVAACVHGGMVAYQAQPLQAEKLPVIHPLTALYAGFKTPTAEAIKRVQQQFTPYPNVFRQLMNGIGQCAFDGVQLAKKGNWTDFGAMMNIQQGLLESLGVSMPVLNEMVMDLRSNPAIMGAKISGAGLGDCVIGLGSMVDHAKMIPVAMTMQGVHCEKI